MDACLSPYALPNRSVLHRWCHPAPNNGSCRFKVSLPLRPLWRSAPGAAVFPSFREAPLPWQSPHSPLSSSCSPCFVAAPAAPLHSLFFPDRHAVPVGFRSLHGINEGTQDTHITMSDLNSSCKLQTLAHSPVHSADVHWESIARCCSGSDSKGDAFTARTF